ncbi:MAG: alpha-galactosidase [Candidatus Aminicenantes bacterium]|nr:alpha-galactosidase [Candidatus Aminicenantes bacterium]
MLHTKKILFMGLGLWLWYFFCFLPSFSAGPPPNRSGQVEIKDNHIYWTYEGNVFFEADIKAEKIPFDIKTSVYSQKGKVTQLLVLTTREWNDSLEVTGRINGSPESFPCEVDRPDRGLLVVRHAYGLSRNLRNRAVYDRARDWAFSVDFNPHVKIFPESSDDEGHEFTVDIKGREVVFCFRPLFYQKHRELSYFEPWNYAVWEKPIVGWCSWFAYFTDINEANVLKTADVLASELAPFGYEYLQIDDGYQRDTGLPELWLNPNEKFPDGLAFLASAIKKKGLKPGIWTNVAFKQKDFVEKHGDFFVKDERGHPGLGNWVGYSIDGANPEAVDRLVRPIYWNLKKMGWEYFKVDALRHLRYEGYNSYSQHFRKTGKDRVEAYRSLVRAIREEIGREFFLLGCWGIRPELIGMIDGCRLGSDGFSYAGLSQYNSFNNIVWRNDPDHIELSPQEAYRSTMVTSLTGSLFLLTDKPEIYLTDLAEPAKRAAPVLFTRPGQLYDVDPSRFSQLDRVGTEVSGSGPRVFDAGQKPSVFLFLLEVNKPFENWVMLGRTAESENFIPFGDLGLNPEMEYLVYEYWTKKLIGSFIRGFYPGTIDPRFNSQLFCVRERKNHPQVLATNRHISCGGYDLEDIDWGQPVLSGRSRLVGGDPYFITVFIPSPYVQAAVACDGAEVVEVKNSGPLMVLHLSSEDSRVVDWFITF